MFDSYRHDLTCCNAKSCVSVMHADVVQEAAHNGKSTFLLLLLRKRHKVEAVWLVAAAVFSW